MKQTAEGEDMLLRWRKMPQAIVGNIRLSARVDDHKPCDVKAESEPKCETRITLPRKSDTRKRLATILGRLAGEKDCF